MADRDTAREFLLADPLGVFFAELTPGEDFRDLLHIRTIDRAGATDRFYDAAQAAQLVDGLAGLVEQMRAGAVS